MPFRKPVVMLLIVGGSMIGMFVAYAPVLPVVAREVTQAADDTGLIRRVERLEERAEASARLGVPVGTVLGYSGVWPPSKPNGQPWDERDLGWMLCDGRPLHRADFGDFARAVAELHGNGSVDFSGAGRAGDFNLPDYRGYFLRGADKGDSDRRPPHNGKAGGGKSGVGSTQPYATAQPNVPFVASPAGSAHTHKLTEPTVHGRDAGDKRGWGGTNVFTGDDFTGTTKSDGEHKHQIAGGDAETRPANAAVHWIIKVRPSP